MNRSTLRWAVIVLTLITAAVHLFLGIGSVRNPDYLTLGILFLLNSAGYVGLLVATLGWVPFIPPGVAHYGLMAFALITIVIWVGMGSRDILAYATKADEVLLIAATFLHLRARE